MNKYQIIMHYLFKRQYVLLIFHDGRRVVKKSYKLGDRFYAHPHLPETRCELLKGGGIDGVIYVTKWLPITKKTFDFYGPL